MLAHNNSHVPYANLLEYLNGGAISAHRLRELQKQTRNIFIISVQFSRHCADVFDTVCSVRHVMPVGKTDFAQVTQSGRVFYWRWRLVVTETSWISTTRV